MPRTTVLKIWKSIWILAMTSTTSICRSGSAKPIPSMTMKNSNHSLKHPQKRGKVSTLDILGGQNGAKVRGKWAEHHKRLTDLRERLLVDKKNHTENAQEELCNFSEHMADAATDSYDRDCALALLSSAQEALYEIDLALNRIAKGAYGICEL